MLLSLRSPSAAGPKSRNQPREQSPYPIWFVGPSVLRICWNSGHGRVVTPRLKRALDQFEQFDSVAEPTRRDRPDWRELSAEEAAELSRELALVHGDEQYSAALLVRLCGVTHNTAWNMIRRPGQDG
ncbi:MAG: hypothetical protein KF774_11450 [Planctomyces sp.]|nr:hypothetical protein [Planctomyces sp.]